MSCDSHRQYLAPSDMAMLERVLAHPGLRQSSGNPAPGCGAAKFVIRKFQEGMTDEGALTVALDRYLRTLWAWRSRPHYSDGSSQAQDWHCSGGHPPMVTRSAGGQQKSAVSPVMVVSDLRGAVNDLGRLTDFQRAKLLQRAAVCIDDCRKQLSSPDTRTIDLDGCDIAFDLAAMVSAIDLFDAAAISKVMRQAVTAIGMLQEWPDQTYPARGEVRVVTRLTRALLARLKGTAGRVSETAGHSGALMEAKSEGRF